MSQDYRLPQRHRVEVFFRLITHQKNPLDHVLWKVFHPFDRNADTSFAEHLKTDQWSIIADGYQMIGTSEVSSFCNCLTLRPIPSQKPILHPITPTLRKDYCPSGTDSTTQRATIHHRKLPLMKTPAQQLEALGYIDLLKPTDDTKSDLDRDGIKNGEDNCIAKIQPPSGRY